MLEWFAQYLGVKVQTMLASFFGALASLLFISSPAWVRRCGLVAAGFASAIYGAELMVLWFGLSARYESGVGFLIGFFSMSLADAIMRAISAADFWQVIRPWLERRSK